MVQDGNEATHVHTTLAPGHSAARRRLARGNRRAASEGWQATRNVPVPRSRICRAAWAG